MEATDVQRILDAISNLNALAPNAGVKDSEWDSNLCLSLLAQLSIRATLPFCDHDCQPLGFCDVDCHATHTACGKMGEFTTLSAILPGGEYHETLKSLIGDDDITLCIADILVYVTGNGNDEDICVSTAASLETAKISLGNEPGVNCILLDENPIDVLNGPNLGFGTCKLKNWDTYLDEVADVDRTNALLQVRRASELCRTNGSYRSVCALNDRS